MRRWVPPGLALIAVALVPWTIWLTTVLPSHEVVDHWDLVHELPAHRTGLARLELLE